MSLGCQLSALVRLVVLVSVAIGFLSPPVAAEAFAPIDMPEPATSYALTEDGTQLVVAHHDVGMVSIIDMKTGLITQMLTCPSARWVLCRGDTTYVLESEQGTVAVFSQKDWKQSDELLIGDKEAYYMSAAQRDRFDGRILITAGTISDHRMLLLDAKKDQCKKVPKTVQFMSVATMSATGDYVFIQGQVNASPSGAVTVVPFANIAEEGIHESTNTDFLTQCQESSFWIGGEQVYLGRSPTALVLGASEPINTGMAEQRWAAMDQVLKRVYLITPAVVTAFGMSTTTPSLGSIALTGAASSHMTDSLLGWRRQVNAVAATFDRTTYLVIPGTRNGILLRAAVPFDAAIPPTTPVQASSGAVAAAVAFAPLDMPEPATSYALTEDGTQLVVAHHDAGKISVIDVKTGTIIRSVTCPSAQWVLCRGDTTYVLESERGVVGVFAQKDWKLVDELLIGDKDCNYMSAAQRDKFEGLILIAPPTHPYRHLLLLDAKKDQCKQVHIEDLVSVATMNATGDTVFFQNELILSAPMGVVRIFQYTKLKEAGISGERVETIFGSPGAYANTAFLTQCQEGSFWIGGDRIYLGKPPKALALGSPEPHNNSMAEQRWAAMDQVLKRAYMITPTGVTAFGLSTAIPSYGSVALTNAVSKQMTDNLRNWRTQTNAVAATIDGTTYLVIPGTECGFILRASVHFDTTSIAAVVTGGGLDDEFPATVVEGTQITRRIGGPGTYEVMTGPKGLVISEDGLLTWTPDKSDLGVIQMKIKIETRSEISFKHFSCEVVPKK